MELNLRPMVQLGADKAVDLRCQIGTSKTSSRIVDRTTYCIRWCRMTTLAQLWLRPADHNAASRCSLTDRRKCGRGGPRKGAVVVEASLHRRLSRRLPGF